ncbi:MAG: T9SS type A sorting domain-containing protein [bacterium]
MKNLLLFGLFYFLSQYGYAQTFTCQSSPDGTIWCDDFEDGIPLAQKYFEYDSNKGDCIVMDGVGRDGSKGIRVRWQAGEVSAGGIKKSFGRTPDNYIGKYSVFPNSSFNEIYWRMDVRHQIGWQGGGPAKLMRALTLANSNWATGAMAHLWSGGKDNVYLGMDPASGVTVDGTLKTTKYNDFDNLRWLGFKSGNIDMFSDENAGRWFCVEGHVRLNTPGENDGIFEFWINDTLQAGSYNLNWHGSWNADPNNMKINAIFFENYWNQGSPVEQERYFDNIVISTKRITCDCGQSAVDGNNISEIAVIYPNPASDYIEISKPSQGFEPSGVTNIQIFNFLGELVMEVEKIPSFVQRIDVSDLSAGVYFIQFDSQRIKFIKL